MREQRNFYRYNKSLKQTGNIMTVSHRVVLPAMVVAISPRGARYGSGCLTQSKAVIGEGGF